MYSEKESVMKLRNLIKFVDELREGEFLADHGLNLDSEVLIGKEEQVFEIKEGHDIATIDGFETVVFYID